MHKNRFFNALLVAVSLFSAGSWSSCAKYLDAMPDKRLAVPSSLEDLQALLESYVLMNASYSALTEVQADNYFVTETDWKSVSAATMRNYYAWQADDNTWQEWNVYGSQLINTNVVLDHIEVLTTPGNAQEAAIVKGTALFYRGFYHFMVAQLFAQPYDLQTAGTDLGIPVRLTSDFNVPAHRSTVQETYKSIVSDLEQAAGLLPDGPGLKARPSKAAAYGTLARVAQAMLDYPSAGAYARRCLDHLPADHLLDYNAIDPASNVPFERFNKEVVFQCVSRSHTFLDNSRLKVDTTLYASYLPGDLRRDLFYFSGADGYRRYKGDYDGNGVNASRAFVGITASEQYLILAESQARQGQAALALETLGQLLRYRWAGHQPIVPQLADAEQVLTYVLAERRKERVMRGTRWMDLRRLMKEPGRAVVPQRHLGAFQVELSPDHPRYTLKMPYTVLQRADMPQNP